MAAVAVAGHGRVVQEEAPAVGLRHARHEADLRAIDHVVAAEEPRRPPFRRLEQIAKRRHRPVVQVRAPQPDAVERLVGVAVGLREVREPVLRRRVERRLVRRKHVGVRIETMTIRADSRDVFHQPHARAVLHAVPELVAAVALEAMLLVERDSPRRGDLVDRIRIFRRRQRPDPVAHALDRRMVDGDGRHARAERGAQVALVHRRVVAVPVQVHALARLLVPQRRIVRGADKLRLRQPVERPVELDGLVGIEGVHPSTAPLRHVGRQAWRHAVAERERRDLQPIHQPEPHEQAFEQRLPLPHRRHPAADVFPRRPVVERAVEHESHERFEIELVRRHPEHDAWRRGGRIADRPAVAQRAIEPDLIDPEPAAPRHADGQVVARLDDQPDGCEPARQLVAADLRQCLEHCVRRQHAADRRQQRPARLAADRPVLELLRDVRVLDGPIGPHRRDRPHGRGEQHDDDDEDGSLDQSPDHGDPLMEVVQTFRSALNSQA